MTDAVKLTEYSHGGGCGCKIAPAVLAQILAEMPQTAAFSNLLVGTENSDDAAVYQINETQAVVVTTDFFMPIVDDASDFGCIAATNALSDVYAMGATPILALAIVGMPINTLPLETIRQILAGGASVCAAANIPLAGGHSIDAPEPIYGLVAVGLVHPAHLKRNDQAEIGDVLILGKPLGVGVLSAALKKGELSAEGYQQMLATTTQLNHVGMALGKMAGVHAMTDVTGFALLGHLLEMSRGAKLAASVNFDAVPVLSIARQLAEQGYATGAAERNWASYGAEVTLPLGFPDWQRKLLCDPQTSGGLLVACAPEVAAEVLAEFAAAGFLSAGIIGEMGGGSGVKIL